MTDKPKITAAAMRAFLVSHYKHERLQGRGEEYVEAIVSYRLRDLPLHDYNIISRHESRTGERVIYDASLSVIHAIHEAA